MSGDLEPRPAEPGWSFAWMQPRRNALCCGLALLPLGAWRDVLHACAVQQSAQAAFGLSLLALVAALALDHYRRARWTRTALWLAVLGLATTPAALTGALAILTGANL
jgi:predicted permease